VLVRLRRCSNPSLYAGLAFHRDSSPACCNTRHTLADSPLPPPASSIMNVNVDTLPADSSMEADDHFLSHAPAEIPGIQPLCSFTRPSWPSRKTCWPQCQPLRKSSTPISSSRPTSDKIYNLIPHIMRTQSWSELPKTFFNAICSAISSARTSSLSGLLLQTHPLLFSRLDGGRSFAWKAEAPFSKNSFCQRKTRWVAAPALHTNRKPDLI